MRSSKPKPRSTTSPKTVRAPPPALAGLFARVELLPQFPHQGREVPEAKRDDLREVIYEERHRIVYRVDADWIRILLVHPSPIPMSAEELETLE